jgi:hypothetical protein
VAGETSIRMEAADRVVSLLGRRFWDFLDRESWVTSIDRRGDGGRVLPCNSIELESDSSNRAGGELDGRARGLK